MNDIGREINTGRGAENCAPGESASERCDGLVTAGSVANLHPRHLAMLREGSAIADEVILARGYRTITDPTELAEFGFDKKQRRPGLLLPLHTTDGGIGLYVFDSDVMTKPDVRQALDRLTEHLQRKGASVSAVYLPNNADGSKIGVDDWFAQGHSVAELEALIDTPRKVVPDTDTLAQAYQRAYLLQSVDREARRIREELTEVEPEDVPTYAGREFLLMYVRKGGHTAMSMKARMVLVAVIAFLVGMVVSGIIRDPRPAQADEWTSELRRQTQAIQQVATEIRELRYVVKAIK